ncbi:MAG: hypothetical protein AAGG48_26965 [Planctomycetota bacterium]
MSSRGEFVITPSLRSEAKLPIATDLIVVGRLLRDELQANGRAGHAVEVSRGDSNVAGGGKMTFASTWNASACKLRIMPKAIGSADDRSITSGY